MPSKRQFYREVIRFEVLSEEPIPDCMSLSEYNYHTMEGHMSGKFLDVEAHNTVDGPTMARLLESHGSDPEFFMLTPDGDDSEEWKHDHVYSLGSDDECPNCRNGTVERIGHESYDEIVCRGECGEIWHIKGECR